jgi:dihydroorotase
VSTVIKNGHLIEPSASISEIMDVAFEGTTITAIGKDLSGDEIIDATGCVVCPGLVDIHVHFREPGFESKETIESGSRCGAAGGFTSVVPMSNTNPTIDNAGMVEFVNRRARETAVIKIWPSACATKGMKGEEITEMAELKEVGVVAVTDDGKDIQSSWVMRRVMEYAKMVNLPYMAHCEDHSLLVNGGAMNEGYNSTRLGIPGIPKAAEEIMIERNARLAELTGAHLHVQHITTAGGIDILRRYKAKGIRITGEASPHHFTLTDDAIEKYDTNAKMNPPLRELSDIDAIKAGIKDGTVDIIATDHAPHTPAEKDVEFALAPFGIIGLETSLSLVLTQLVDEDVISLERAIEMMTVAGAKIVDIDAGTLREGGPADICIFNPDEKWTIDKNITQSNSRNTPFHGREVRGIIKYTICDGETVFTSKSR